VPYDGFTLRGQHVYDEAVDVHCGNSRLHCESEDGGCERGDGGEKPVHCGSMLFAPPASNSLQQDRVADPPNGRHPCDAATGGGIPRSLVDLGARRNAAS